MPRSRVLLLCAAAATASCSSAPRPGDPLPRRGDEISVCGQLFHTGTRVVLWNDPGGYDAYRVGPRFGSRPAPRPSSRPGATTGPWYDSFRRGLPRDLDEKVREQGWELADLRRAVRLFVVHYDVCGTSRECFRVLHDARGLSVHFLLDVDGTVYQTLDLKERAWHATVANDASVGIELAHIGAYPAPDDPALRSWYARDGQGTRVVFPESLGETGIRTPRFVARPARDALVSGRIHGRVWWQYDFTEEQYRALARLTAALSRVLPRIRLEVPRDPDGNVRADALSEDELAAFAGVVGHWHVTATKHDPGPALDWERVLSGGR